jgi:hypothetical protein
MKKKSFGQFDRFEKQYETNLKKISRVVASIIDSATINGVIKNPVALEAQLKAYSELIDGWANDEAERMFNKVSSWNKRTFASQSKQINSAMKLTMADSRIGLPAQLWQKRQVELIKSLPIESAKKAQELSMQASIGGERAKSIEAKIMNLGSETNNRARVIARTEISKANASLTKARAEFVGATHYIWRNMKDAVVRDAHRMYKGKPLDGQIFAFASPPTLDDGTTGNPGEFPNCRCYAEPIIDDKAKINEEAEVDFGTIKEPDLTKQIDAPFKTRWQGDWEKKINPTSGLTLGTEDKIGKLNFALKQQGHKGVDAKDFKAIVPLTRVLKSPRLFSKYPDLQERNVMYIDFHTAKKRGVRIDNTIFINSKLMKKDPLKMRSTLIHEIEHLKQDIKGVKITTSEEMLSGKAKFAKAFTGTRETQARAMQEKFMQQQKKNS